MSQGGESPRLEVVTIEIPEGANIIVGRSHFIKSVEDIYEALVTSSTSIKFGLAFNEASGKRLIRYDGNDKELIDAAVSAAKRIGAGHIFVIFLKNAWPINVLNALKNVQEVVNLYVATSNPVQIIVAETNQGRAVLGAVDGYVPVGIEQKEDVEERIEFLKKIGYKR
ncbi:MAG: adenosine-specific kinase [Fervidicoccaceae archaeon]